MHLHRKFVAGLAAGSKTAGRACRRAAGPGQILEISLILERAAMNWRRESRGGTLPGMRDPDDDDDPPPPREDRLFGSSGFRRKLSEGLTGLLDPDGALGKGKDFVTGVSQATKTEVVRMVSAEVRNFLDGMDTKELMQSVIAGLVIDVKAEIRFSIDPNGQLKTSMSTKDSEVRNASDPPKKSRNPETARPEPSRHEPTRPEPTRQESRAQESRHESTRHESARHEPSRPHEPTRHEPTRHEPTRHDSNKPGGKHE